MPSPDRRLSCSEYSDGGPPRSKLARILEEINQGLEEPSKPAKPLSSLSRCNSFKSLWVGGNQMAQDARDALRARDQARATQAMPQTSVPALRRHSTLGQIDNCPTTTSVWTPSRTSPGLEWSAERRASAFAGSTQPVNSDVSNATGTYGSLPYRPASAQRRKRTYDLASGDNSSDAPKTKKQCSDDIGPLASPNFWSSVPQSMPNTSSTPSPSTTTPRKAYIAFSQPDTPTEVELLSSPVAATPGWARPLQLVDGEQRIYSQTHGSDMKKGQLCLVCFRQRGKFRKIYEEGCEDCGGYDVLENYFCEED